MGEIADGANALIYLAEGDKVNAALSAAAMLPVGGQAATAAKLGRKAGQKLEKEAAEKAAREAALKAEREAAKKAEKEAAEKAAKEKAVKEGGHVKGPKKKKLREQYLGRTPGKKSKTGREVIERMEKDGKIERNPITNKVTKFMDSQGNWRDIKDADMAHSKDAVTWWNETGRKDVARSPEVRKWMLDSENYTLDYFKYNRSAGAKLPDRYLPPLK
ncbi:MAG: GH-E family nuclease [Methylococcales bacterium]